VPRAAAETAGAPRKARGNEHAEVRLDPGVRRLPFGTLDLALDESGLTWAGYGLEHFVSTTTLGVRGLRNRYRRPGIGAPLAASLAASPTADKIVGAERIGARTKVPVTAFVRLENARAGLASGRIHGRLELYAADRASTVTVDGQEQPLEVDPTAALAYQLEHNPLYKLEITAFLRGGFFGSQLLPRDRTQDGLYTLQPYQPGKFPVVLVHGTASSPTRWAELVNELGGDPRIRARYQIWLFLYDSGNPIGYSAGRLRAALTTAVAELDPAGTDAALRRMVVIGHSQGGLLTKLTAIDTGSRLWDRISDEPLDEADLEPETRALLRQSMFFTPLPFVSRVVFISTPHRGALLATGRIGAIAAALIRMPTNLLGQVALAATTTRDERLAAALRNPPTAVDNMNPRHPALRIVASIPVPPGTPAHSIIAVKGDGPPEDGNDGVVAYTSAHIDEAVSELVVRSSHSCQGKPETIEEVRRILLEHAAVPDDGPVLDGAWDAAPAAAP
jgi:pimeloyl-ACP methyl ester carboxylesterase